METLIPALESFIGLYTAIGFIALMLLLCFVFVWVYRSCCKAEKRIEDEQYKRFKERFIAEVQEELDKELDYVSLDLRQQKK